MKKTFILYLLLLLGALQGCDTLDAPVRSGEPAYGVISSATIGAEHNRGLKFLLDELPASYEDSSDQAVKAWAEVKLQEFIQDSLNLDPAHEASAIAFVPEALDTAFSMTHGSWVAAWNSGLRDSLLSNNLICNVEDALISRLINFRVAAPTYTAAVDSLTALASAINGSNFTGTLDGELVRIGCNIGQSTMPFWHDLLDVPTNPTEEGPSVAQGYVDLGAGLVSAGFSALKQYKSNGSVDLLDAGLDGLETGLTSSFAAPKIGGAIQRAWK
jgi:hypothetical protein